MATQTQVPQIVPIMNTGGRVAAIVPTTWAEVTQMAGAFVRAEMVPKQYSGSPEKTAIAIMAGMEVGLTPLAAIQSIFIINNIPTLFGDGMVALVQGSGLLEDIREMIEYDEGSPFVPAAPGRSAVPAIPPQPTMAVCRVKRRGIPTWKEHVITRPMCQRAGWWGKSGPWSSNPGRMMQVRARGWCFRDMFADVLKGLASAEEEQDMMDVTSHGDATFPEPQRADFNKNEIAAHNASSLNTQNPQITPAAGAPAQQPREGGQSGVDVVPDTGSGLVPPASEPDPSLLDDLPNDDFPNDAAEMEWPREWGREGEDLTFNAYTSALKFIEFANDFLPKTNAEGCRQFVKFYEPSIKALEKNSANKNATEAGSWIRAQVAEKINPPDTAKA